MGKTRVIAETGAGQHGVATATACALPGPRPARSTWARRTPLGGRALQRVPHADAGGRGHPGDRRAPGRLQGRHERGHFRDWVTTVETTAHLLHRLGRRPAPVPDDGPRLPADHRGGGIRQQVQDCRCRSIAGRSGRLRRRRLERDRRLPRLYPRPDRPAHRLRALRRTRRQAAASGRAAARSPWARPAVLHGACAPTCSQDDEGQTLDPHLDLGFLGPRLLPGASALSTPG